MFVKQNKMQLEFAWFSLLSFNKLYIRLLSPKNFPVSKFVFVYLCLNVLVAFGIFELAHYSYLLRIILFVSILLFSIKFCCSFF